TAWTFAILFAAKLTVEAITGGAVFANDMGDDVVAVPVAHLAGAIAGVLSGVIACSSTLFSCGSSWPCSSR
ncbi:MAG TPA: hypothetical protein VEU30_14015, partial [Thermoanaerobaculia bacterium]|nr:hypothetical protein [Thermoanaerobaculia bacterium]